MSTCYGEVNNVEYINVKNFDHKMLLIDYSFAVPKIQKSNDLHLEYVMSKKLEKDEIFIEGFCELLSHIDNLINSLSSNLSPSYIWYIIKNKLINWAKAREKTLKKEEMYYYNRLKDYYGFILEDMKMGVDCREELNNILNELDLFYKVKIEENIQKAKYIEIKDNVFDIIKKQKLIKFSNGGKIDKIKIDGEIFEEPHDIVENVEKKMREELKYEDNRTVYGDSSDIEGLFLQYLPKLNLDDETIKGLNSDIDETEIFLILDSEVDIDSSPGIDGLTYRFIKLFWNNKIFRKYYLNFINYIKETGKFEENKNVGLMVLKNKKGAAIDYSKKRKLTKLNKDINLLAKVWSNRCKRFLMTKIVPDSQFVCRSDANIVDELRHLRDINLFFIG